ncbi:unnamed protein product [Arctia plantaginis]|uniref:Uncharacterized protein n=1 Tax=Arctia plantaginis TaxID=874455 RepID=A0A8S1BGG0_ARCPL|nr:unnamed protein product [Arctia plantaginis]
MWWSSGCRAHGAAFGAARGGGSRGGRIWSPPSVRPHCEPNAGRRNSPKFGVFSKRHTMRPQDLQKPLLQQNLADALLLKVHNNNEFHKDKEAQANRRSEYVQGVERNTVKEIQQVLHDHNI